jgi:hypothetical protein
MDALAQRIAAFIEGPPSAEGFDELALELFHRQYACVEPYRLLCDSLGVTPASCKDWSEIPLVPAAAFKRYALTCAPVDQAKAVYYSSGTTGSETSKHYMDADGLALYRTSLGMGFVSAIPEAVGKRIWALMPSPQQMPNSSLSAMLDMLGAERFYWESDAHLLDDLHELQEPIVLFGTAFAFVQLFDMLPEPIRLPAGTIIVETGGFKGRVRSVRRSDLYEWFAERLGVDNERCYSEYGMSEMASQFYSRGVEDLKRGPHWVRTRIIDPLTGKDAVPGHRGLLAHYDLANFNSVMAIQTEDSGCTGASVSALTALPAPPRSGEGGEEEDIERRKFVRNFVLMGRAQQADLRGCSLTVEELWAKSQKP